MKITEDIRYVGVNDHRVDLFEGQYPVPNGMSYNSYVVLDEKVTVFDTVDSHFGEAWLGNVRAVLGGRKPDYLVVQHMEPDHSANVAAFLAAFPEAKVVSSAPAFAMMKNFFGTDFADRRVVVKEGDTLATGRHTFAFVAAPMVHWPEVIVTYDTADKVLFSADGFGKFGANDVADPEGWDCEARRYYIGIVGKFGAQVMSLLKKAAGLDIKVICPLHGPVLDTPEAIAHALKQYTTWASYAVESEGVLIAYTSVYGHTKAAVEELAALLKARGCPKVVVADLARDETFETVEDAFRYGKLVLATTTYNGEIFPFMRTFISHLTERSYQNRTVGLIENGTWAPTAARVMKGLFEKSKNVSFCETTVTVRSALDARSRGELAALADELCGATAAAAPAPATEAVRPSLAAKLALLALGSLLSCLTPAFADGEPAAAAWTEARAYTNAAGKVLLYRWAEPAKVEPGKAYPLVILFHGAGERGADNVRQLVWGAEPLLRHMRARGIEGYFIAGQVPNGQQWVDTPWGNVAHRMPATPSEPMALALELVDRTLAERPVDRSRVYATGISMGGYGTWDAVQRRPELFAAAMPICGGGDTHLAWKIRDVPIWTWHGDADTVVPTVRSREMVSALWAVDGKVRYTEVPGCGHGAWGPAYESREALDWLFSRRKATR